MERRKTTTGILTSTTYSTFVSRVSHTEDNCHTPNGCRHALDHDEVYNFATPDFYKAGLTGELRRDVYDPAGAGEGHAYWLDLWTPQNQETQARIAAPF